MKRRPIYVVLILFIVLGSWLLLNHRENNSASEKQVQEVLPTSTVDTNTTMANVTVNNRETPVQYLDPAYKVTVKHDILYASKKNETDAEEPLKLDLYQPIGDETKQRPVFIFIHGGGYTGGDKSDAADFSEGLAKRGYAVLTIDYRLKKDPFFNFTRTLNDANEDINDVIKWINEHAETYGLNKERIVIGGDSAGGHLAKNFVNLSLAKDPSLVKSVFSIIDIYGGELTRSADSKLPPVLIIHGTIDKMVPYQQSVDLAAQLKEKGIYHNLLTMEGVGHDYKNEKYIDEIMETTAHFLWNVMNSSDLASLPENSGITVASGSAFDIKLPEAYRSASKEPVNIDLPEGWLLSGEDEGSLRIQVPESLVRGNDSLFVSRGADPTVASSFTMNINVIDPLAVYYETFYEESTKEIKTYMDVTNQSTSNFSGSVEADYETGRSTRGTYASTVENLEPGKSVRLEIPELARGQRSLKVFNDIGTLLQSAVDSSNVLLLPKLSPPVQIVGNLSDWGNQAPFDVKDVKIMGWQGEQDLSAKGSLAWDADNLYLGVEVIDDYHAQSASGDAIWSGDSIQIGIGIANGDGTVPSEYHELGVARGDTGELLKWCWLAPKGFNLGDVIELQYAVERKDSKTSYELAIPWRELKSDDVQVKPGMKLKFSLLVNDNDGEGRKGWVEYNSGIGSAKDVDAFGDLFVH
ncbi:alpha/beta hydrolase fold domain-containing protein [Paenibacillus sp. FSL R7-0048]|uniref:prolyl oligopeptidase family serine peptidase n=1 Tax=Paenibacillus sp. FSL R7-0048 TaxID=2954528 RepID=UPI0030FAAACE